MKEMSLRGWHVDAAVQTHSQILSAAEVVGVEHKILPVRIQKTYSSVGDVNFKSG